MRVAVRYQRSGVQMAGLTQVRVNGPRLSSIRSRVCCSDLYVIHLGEEWVAAGGFPLWAERTLAIRSSNAEFTVDNVGARKLCPCVGAWLVSRDPKFRFIEIALAVAVLGNVALHVFASLLTWMYLARSGQWRSHLGFRWVPCAFELHGALAYLARRYCRASYLGFAVVLIHELAVLVVGSLRRPLMSAAD